MVSTDLNPEVNWPYRVREIKLQKSEENSSIWIKLKEMRAVFIIFNQAHTERVEYIHDQLEIRRFTWWNLVSGKGSETGEPRMGTLTWPEMNSALITITSEDKVQPLLDRVKKVDEINKEVGIRAFVWDITQSI